MRHIAALRFQVLAISASFSLVASAGCQPPVPATTERIIRIQIEGCEDATPLPFVPTPTPTPVAVEIPTKVAVAPDTQPEETPATIQPRVERTPPPPARTPEMLAEEFALKREGFLATLAESKFNLLDVPEAAKNVRKADDLLRVKNYDEALRYVEVAILEAQSVRLNEAFITAKLRRVESRVDAMRPTLGKPAEKKADEALKKANTAFMENKFRISNLALYELEQLLDRRSPETPRKPIR